MAYYPAVLLLKVYDLVDYILPPGTRQLNFIIGVVGSFY